VTQPITTPGDLAATLPDCPYVGLTPFTEADAPFFFGRETDRRILISNLSAARLTLVYGPSGVGKSSLLRAGVARDLRSTAEAALKERRLPEAIGVVFASWRDDPLVGLADLLATTVCDLLAERATAPVPREAKTLDELLAAWNERLDTQARRLELETNVRQPEHVDLLLILDQFEEYFLYHPDEIGPGTFASEFARAVNRRELRANFLVSVRDDAYTQLDRFEDEIPNIFGNNIRIEHLGQDAAEDAIRGPVARYAELGGSGAGPADIEDGLVDAVLSQVRTGTVVLGQAGGGIIESDESEADLRVETPFLQLVMQRLWYEERESGSQVLRLRTLERLGGAERIVRAHLDQAVSALDEDAQDVAGRVFGRLVTPSGTKIAHLPSDLAALEDIPIERLMPMLEGLSQARILRSVAPAPGEKEPRYEIFHDVLAPAVLEWRARWLQAREHAEAEQRLNADLERQKEERLEAEKRAVRESQTAQRFRLLFLITGLLALGAVGLAAWAGVEWHNTNVANKRAQVSDLRRRTSAALASDPGQAIALAARAVRNEGAGNQQGWAVAALRQALQSSSLVAVLRPGEGAVRMAAFGGDGRVVTVAGRYVDLWNASDGSHVLRLAADTDVLDAALSPDGSRVVGAGADGRLLLWNVSDHGLRTVQPGLGRILRVSFSRDGNRVIAASAERLVTIRGAKNPKKVRPVALPRSWVVAAFSPAGTLLRAANTKTRTGCVANSSTGTAAGFICVPFRLRAKRPKTDQGIRDQSPPQLGIRDQSPPQLQTAALSPDGRLIGTGDNSGTARVWDARLGRVRVLTSHRMSGAVTSVAFDTRRGTRTRVVTGSADGSVHVWRAATGKLLVALKGHTDQVGSVAFSPDGRWILTASDDRTAALWNAATGTREAVLLGHRGSVRGAAFSSNGTRIVTVSDDGTARLWRLPIQQPDLIMRPCATKRHCGPRGIPFGGIYDASFGPKGARILIVPDETAGAALFDSESGLRRRTFDHDAPFAALSADEKRVLTASPGHVASWDANTGDPIASVKMWVGMRPVASADGRRIVLATSGGFRLWDTRDAKPGPLVPFLRKAYPNPAFAISAVGLSGDGRYLALLSRNGLGAVFDLKMGQRLGPKFKTSSFEPSLFELSPDGRSVVGTAALSEATTEWATVTGKPLLVFQTYGTPSIVRFSPRGARIVTGDRNAAHVWNAHSGLKIATLLGHAGPITDAAFSPNGRHVATASDDGTARVWDAGTGELLYAVRQGRAGDATHVSFDATGTRVLVTGSDGTAAIYNCFCGGGSVSDLLKLAEKLEPHTRTASD
jgi:WD40 repeat protein